MNPKLSQILQQIEKVVVGKNENVEKIMMAVFRWRQALPMKQRVFIMTRWESFRVRTAVRELINGCRASFCSTMP